ncbi:MAG TPA: type ISP restriction/modification enzyme, partial [Edaphocola sp.]|nr:type ISP restriction/modification enzyme [Edaphocola sp.]
MQFNIKNNFNTIFNPSLIKSIAYRPFDIRKIYWDTSLIERSREKIMNNFLIGDNLGLASIRINKEKNYSSLFVTNSLADARLSDRFLTSIFPLYLYTEKKEQISIEENPERVPNLNMEIVDKIAESLGMYFSPEQPDYNVQTEETAQLYPIYILDYIYAVLHSPTYREKYKEFLKIDFPRVPYPKDADTFMKLVELGSQIRKIHLLESPVVEAYITQYPIDG